MPEEQTKTTDVHVRLPVEEKEWLYAYAKQQYITISQLVRQIIREYRELIAE